VHNAFGTDYNWDWFRGLLGGAELYDHAALQTGTVDVLDPSDASTASLPRTWTGEDEWYNLVPAPQGVRFLAAVDDRTLAQGQRGYYGDPGMGPFHPVTWCQYYDGGKAWLTTLGHDAGDWESPSAFPGAQYFQQMLLGGMESAMGMKPFCQGFSRLCTETPRFMPLSAHSAAGTHVLVAGSGAAGLTAALTAARVPASPWPNARTNSAAARLCRLAACGFPQPVTWWRGTA